MYTTRPQKTILKKKIAQGIIFLSGKRLVLQVVVTCSNIILARLLVPEDFGTYALVIFTSVFLAVFSDIGLGASLIQKREEIEKSDIQTAFTIQVCLSILIIFVIFITSPFLVEFFSLNKNILWLFRLYALTFLFLPFKSISAALLERELQYKRLAVIEIAEIIIASIVTIICAFKGMGVFSFVYGVLVSQSIGVALYLIFSHLQIGFRIDIKSIRALMQFGLPFQNHVVLGLFYGPLILLYLGKIVGSEQLGYYQFAAGVAVFPLAVSEIISRMMFSLVARTAVDREVTRKIVEGGLIVAVGVTFPLIVVFGTLSKPLIETLYTTRWLPALPVLQVLLLQTHIVSFTSIFIQILLGLGHSNIMRKMGIIWTAVTWISGPLLIGRFGILGMSITSLMAAISGLYLYHLLRKHIQLSLGAIVSPFLLAAILQATIIILVRPLLSSALLKLVIAGGLGTLFYTLLIWQMKKKTLQSLIPLYTRYIK